MKITNEILTQALTEAIDPKGSPVDALTEQFGPLLGANIHGRSFVQASKDVVATVGPVGLIGVIIGAMSIGYRAAEITYAPQTVSEPIAQKQGEA